MDFTPTEEQSAASALAAEIFADLSTPERLAGLGTAADAELWKALCAAGLPGAVEETGLLGLVLLLGEQGRTTAQVPFAASCVYGLLALGAHGSAAQRERLLPGLRAGDAVATGAFPAQSGVRAEGLSGGAGRLTGVVPVVPWLREATHVLVADARQALWLVRTDDPGVRRDPVATTAPWSAGRLGLDGAPGERLGGAGAYADVLATARIAFAALQAGVCAGSLARAVAHTTTREQFGRPLSTNQGVLLRAADACMDTEAIRVTAYEAAWRRDEGLDAAPHALTAAWWAAEAGTRVVHTGQHLHGGIGADVDHPVHRHFLWGRQLAAYLGSGAQLLEEMGELLAMGELLGTDRMPTPHELPNEEGRA
ncbi:acyl-CoA dehydrogenase family protein [Streptomyces sp. NPDC048483]|uniref:acyl-CoA dehydrogenase family protein n=1 Tax=Streptomyces sp. NPDC048483 TaxID=3154927 RepID=UPI00342FD44B